MADKKPARKHKFRKEGPHGKGRGTDNFRTPSGDVSANARREAKAEGDAMPDGSFPIRNAADLERAKKAFGRAKDKPAVRRWINKRAKELGEPPLGGDVGKSRTERERGRYRKKTVKKS